MIRLNVDEEVLRTGVGLERIVQQIFWYQVFYKDAIGKDIRLMKLQKDMYNAKNGERIAFIRKPNRTEAYYNLLKPLCDTATSTFIGRVPDIVSNGSKEEIKRISRFTLIQKHNDFEEELTDAALNMSITGSGFLCLYADVGDVFPHYRSLDPLYTNVVYDSTVAMKRLFAYHIYYEAGSDGSKTGGRYVCIIYTKDKMYAYYTGQISIPAKMAFSVFPYNLFLINGVQETYSAPHGFNDIPIYEFMNNKACISDCKPALSVIELYGELQNNRFQNVDDIINYLLVIKNARMGNEEETQKAIDLIKNNRVLPISGENTDAKFLSNPLNQKDIQTLSYEFKNLIHYITHIPDLTSEEFSQNASDPILKMKTKPLLDLCMEKEKWFNKSYLPMLETTLEFVKKNDKTLYEKVKFEIDNVDLVYSHTLPSNDRDMVNNIVNLTNAGLINPRIALQGLSFIPNVDEYLKGVYEYNEYVDKRNETKKNNNIKANDNNLEKQNQKPQTTDQEDNMDNATIGQGEKVSENKVE